MSCLSYEIVDVFTDRPFTGNPLAVVFGAEALAGEQLQSLAREFNLSETVFVLPPSAGAGGAGGAAYRARIFTPAGELPFAGHPSVGAAVTAVRRGLCQAGVVVQECGAGLLPIVVDDSSTYGRARLTGGTPTVGPELDPGPLLAAVGLTAGDLAGPAPRLAGCGLEFAYLAVRPDAVARAALDRVASDRVVLDTATSDRATSDRATSDRATSDRAASDRAASDRATAAGLGAPDISVFAWEPDPRAAHARVFCPGLGIAEDPATGSAALGLGVWLVASGLLPGDGESAYTVRQGIELHRPSTLECTVRAADGMALELTVAGEVVPIARGEIAVPPFVG